jgi:invasion protein IalB
MNDLLKTVPFLVLMAFGGAALAQTATNETPAPDAAATEEAAPNPMALSMGNDGPAVGDVYIADTFDDWELRCIKSEGDQDPCQLYQLLKDPKGNPVAEMNIFPLTSEDQAAAGATVITPLETLLTSQLGMSVDGGQVKKYPFSWCSAVGCFSRMGFSDADVAAFKRGVTAALIIVPVAAPDKRVNLTVSLKGFTAAFEAAKTRAAH